MRTWQGIWCNFQRCALLCVIFCAHLLVSRSFRGHSPVRASPRRRQASFFIECPNQTIRGPRIYLLKSPISTSSSFKSRAAVTTHYPAPEIEAPDAHDWDADQPRSHRCRQVWVRKRN